MAKPISLSIPDGYQVPEGVTDGSTFDESVTFKVSGGKLTLTAINGIPLPGHEDGTKAKADSGGLADRYAAAAAGATGM